MILVTEDLPYSEKYFEGHCQKMEAAKMLTVPNSSINTMTKRTHHELNIDATSINYCHVWFIYYF
jgi:hypothetical protein